MGTLDHESRLDADAELAATREPLPAKLEAVLDSYHVRPLLEYLGRRLGLAVHTSTLDVKFAEGRVRGVYLHRGPLGVLQLEELARPAAPPVPPSS